MASPPLQQPQRRTSARGSGLRAWVVYCESYAPRSPVLQLMCCGVLWCRPCCSSAPRSQAVTAARTRTGAGARPCSWRHGPLPPHRAAPAPRRMARTEVELPRAAQKRGAMLPSRSGISICGVDGGNNSDRSRWAEECIGMPLPFTGSMALVWCAPLCVRASVGKRESCCSRGHAVSEDVWGLRALCQS